MSEVAFIGLGNMGAPMALNLQNAGWSVRGYNVSESCRASAVARGIIVADELTQAVAGAETIITMLPAGAHVVDVYRSALPIAQFCTLLVDSSTIDIASCREAHRLATLSRKFSLDAPVSGGVGGALAGKLTFMLGGAPEAAKRAESLLKPMAGRVIYCGGPGTGQSAKICNNMILGISMIAVSEAFVLGERLGLDHQALFDAASVSSGQCWALTTNCPVPGLVPMSPANNEYRPGFAAALMLKDLILSQEAALASGVQTPLGRHARQIYQQFVAKGLGGLDFSAIVNGLRDGGETA